MMLSHAFALPAWPLNVREMRLSVREMRLRPVSLSLGCHRCEFLQLDCGAFRKCAPYELKKNAARRRLLPVAQTRDAMPGEKEDVPETRAQVWGNTWYPLQFEELADKAAPSSCTILAAPVVFWWDSVALQWAAVLDICPHRLVPLSEGRVCGKTGHIECPYHGWTFRGTDGSCAKIPQLEAGKEINQARARATHVPVLVRDGIIWCWGGALVSGSSYADPLPPDESILERLLVESIRAPGVMKLDYFRDLPMDATILTENVLDPSHLPFTHHKTISRRTRAAPIDLKLHGKVERHGFKAFKGNVTGGGVAFTAPHHVLSVTHRKNSFSDWNVVYAVPQRPGRCRVFVRVVFQVSEMPPPMSWLFAVVFRMPPWVSHLSNHKILEDDNIFLHHQDKTLRSPHPHNTRGAGICKNKRAQLLQEEHSSVEEEEDVLARAWQTRYYLPSRADSLVAAYRRWLDRYTEGRGAAWWPLPSVPFPTERDNPPTSPPPRRALRTRQQQAEVLTRAQLVERFDSHTRHCVSCKKALAVAEALARACSAAIVGVIVSAMLLPPGLLRVGCSLSALFLAALLWVCRYCV